MIFLCEEIGRYLYLQLRDPEKIPQIAMVDFETKPFKLPIGNNSGNR